MSNGIEQSVEEMVTEIAMSSDNKPWLILEGATDKKFFLSPRYDTTFCRTRLGKGGRNC
jgi:hypothetical protein